MMSERHSDLPGVVVAVDAPGRRHRRGPAATAYQLVDDRHPEPGEPVTLRAVPYFTWANRGADAMRVWIPQS